MRKHEVEEQLHDHLELMIQKESLLFWGLVSCILVVDGVAAGFGWVHAGHQLSDSLLSCGIIVLVTLGVLMKTTFEIAKLWKMSGQYHRKYNLARMKEVEDAEVQ